MNAGPARSRWWVCGLLFAATLLNYLDRQALAVAAPLVRADLRLGLQDLGLVFSAFYWAYAVGQVVVGTVMDRVPVKHAYAVAVTAWSIAGAAAALARGLSGLLVARVALGVCEAANWPAALRVVARVFPARERALASGLFQSGTSVGALLAPLLVVPLGQRHGWRASFVLLGACGLLWTVAWLWLFREPLAQREARSTMSLAQVLRAPGLPGLALASAFLNPCLYFQVNWLPTYLVSAGQEFGPRLAASLLVVYLALDLGYLTGGLLVMRLSRGREVVAARRMLVTLATPLMCAVVVVMWLRSAWAITAVLALAAVGLGWFMVCYLAFVAEVAPRLVSTAAGLLGAAGSISGGIFMWLVGAVSQRTGSFAWAFVMVGVMPLAALASIRRGTRGVTNDALRR